jgi:hypothetical protein
VKTKLEKTVMKLVNVLVAASLIFSLVVGSADLASADALAVVFFPFGHFVYSPPSLSKCPARGSSERWKNHGSYVSTLTKTAQSFREKGLISESDKGAITSEAADSDCGK